MPTVKILTSHKWQNKFAEVATQFGKHKAGIQLDLQIHANVTLVTNRATLKRIEHNVEAVMLMAFDNMRTSDEREVLSFVKGTGGLDKVLKTDQFLPDLLAKQKAREDAQTTREQGQKKRDQGHPGFTASEMRKEISKDVEDLLVENAKSFEQKFQLQKAQIEELKGVIKHESD